VAASVGDPVTPAAGRRTGTATAAVHPDQAARRGSQPRPRFFPRGARAPKS
jgi:hypothetical protein